jgi:hypothetical protein
MARKPVRRTQRPRRVARAIDQTKGAGAPAPESAAATKPFYAPSDSTPEEIRAAHAAHLAAETGVDPSAHVERVQRQSVPVDEISSADHSLARKALAEETDVEPEPGENLESDINRVRSLRRPLGAYTQKLALPKRAGYHSHWFNGEGGRIDDALANGWAHRKDADGKPVKRAVGRGRDQGVLYAYAMDLPEVFWLEDMAERHKVAAERMEGLKASPFQAKSGQAQRSDQGKFYSPVEGREPIEIEKV